MDDMLWDPADFHPLALSTLQAHANTLIPLSAKDFQPQDLPPGLLSISPDQLFPQARDAKAALSGLLLLAGHWDLSHQVSQDIDSREGSYWHAIVHRIEPDAGNSGYWFRRVGEHPIFSAIYGHANSLLTSAKLPWRLKDNWDPKLFIDWCDEARNPANGPKRELCQQLQRSECDFLLTWCALKQKTC